MIKGKCKIHHLDSKWKNNVYRGMDGSLVFMLTATRPTRSYSVYASVDTGIHPTLNTRGITVWGDSTVRI
jgi:hypothetical protein